MVEIRSIAVFEDGKPTEAGVSLMRMVHEAMDMGCWHELDHEAARRCHDSTVCCSKCHNKYKHQAGIDQNPAYLQSIDAWRPVWDKMLSMGEALLYAYWQKLTDLTNSSHPTRHFYLIRAEPHHHLEALASVLEVECNMPNCCAGIIFQEKQGVEYQSICARCNQGKRKIIDIWAEAA